MTREQALNYLKSSGFSKEQIQAIVEALSGTTKNNLGVDAISRQALYDALYERFHEEDTNNITNVTLGSVRNFVKNFPSVTPQEPKSEWEHDHEILKSYSDGANEVLDKIKEDIQFIKDKCLPNTIAEEYEQKGLQEALDIIDRYKAESENP